MDTSESLCYEFLSDYADYVAPGAGVLPWHGLNVSELYNNVMCNFLNRAMDDNHLFPFNPPASFSTFVAKLSRHLKKGPGTIINCRTDGLIMMLMSYFYHRHIDPSAENHANQDICDVILTYVSSIPWYNLEHIPSDRIFFNRIEFIWKLIRNHQLSLAGKMTPSNILSFQGNAMEQVTHLVKDFVKTWSFDTALPELESDLSTIWGLAGSQMIMVQATQWIFVYIHNVIVNLRTSPDFQSLKLDNVTRHVLDVIDAWFPKESIYLNWINYNLDTKHVTLKLQPCKMTQDEILKIAEKQCEWHSHLDISTTIGIPISRNLLILALLWPNPSSWHSILKNGVQENDLSLFKVTMDVLYVTLDIFIRGWSIGQVCIQGLMNGNDNFLDFSTIDAVDMTFMRHHSFIITSMMFQLLKMLETRSQCSLVWQHGQLVVECNSKVLDLPTDVLNLVTPDFIDSLVSLFVTPENTPNSQEIYQAIFTKSASLLNLMMKLHLDLIQRGYKKPFHALEWYQRNGEIYSLIELYDIYYNFPSE